ncbi:MAG: HlyD family efflux transporter periplasmic adaptor subunit [Rhodopirellula sp.]|nr:HlyD family efflux transporter periplasmic adaptor subunit [Rhodopirellula sp.]
MKPAGTNRRFGFARRVLAMLLPLVAIPVGAAAFLPGSTGGGPATLPLICCAERKEFTHEILAKGALESAVNVEVKCEVHSRLSSWVRILEVVPEGTYVEPGDFLVRLDSAFLEADFLQQQITCEQSEALMVQARAACEAARFAQKEYLNGEYLLQHQNAQMKLFLAQEELRKARDLLESGRRLAAKGYLSAKQLEADVFAVKSAENDLSSARIALDVLENLTKARRMKSLESLVAINQARFAAREQVFRTNIKRLAEIEEQIDKCVIRAPVAGQVVLAHLHHNDHSHMVEPGEEAREGRALIRLPDARYMQVKAEITEEYVSQVTAGMPVTVELEAFPGRRLKGHVKWVNEFPKPEEWFNSSAKKYETVITIDDPFPGLRTGMTADLKILACRESQSLVLPTQSVLRHGDGRYVLTTDGLRWQAIPVEVGRDNGRYTTILSGIDDGAEVVLDAATHRAKVELPELPRQTG